MNYSNKEKIQLIIFAIIFIAAIIVCGKTDTVFIANGMIP